MTGAMFVLVRVRAVAVIVRMGSVVVRVRSCEWDSDP